jgi:hypothetical protein
MSTKVGTGTDRHAKDTWTVFKIMGEFVEGFETLRPFWPSVSVFGSARVGRGHRYYKDAVAVGEALSAAGYSVITGGGVPTSRSPTNTPTSPCSSTTSSRAR